VAPQGETALWHGYGDWTQGIYWIKCALDKRGIRILNQFIVIRFKYYGSRNTGRSQREKGRDFSGK